MAKYLRINCFRQYALLFILLPLFFCKCNKVAQVPFVSYKSYYPLQPGKCFIYQLDSTVTLPFGTGFVTHSYIIKDSVINVIYDAANRPALQIFRYIKDANNVWQSNNTFMVSIRDSVLEYVEDNQRYIKLASPVSTYTTWQGNAYLGASPFDFDNSFLNWQYSYADIGMPQTFNGITYPNTVTVVQYDSTQNKPFYQYGYNFFAKSYEVYADSVGLVYKDLLDWDYQPVTYTYNCLHIQRIGNVWDTTAVDCNAYNSPCDSINNLNSPTNFILCDTALSSFAYNGYGVKQVLISHN
jgi:hypothetical protein